MDGGVVVDEVVVWSNPRDENGNSHADLRCDCHYAHPVCWHCGFRAPPCLQLSSERFDGDIIRTRFLEDSAIYIEGEPYIVLFCNACYAEKEAHYSIVPQAAYDGHRAFVWLSAWYQSQHGSRHAPMPAPGPPPFVQHNPEDDYDGFSYEEDQEDAAACECSEIESDEGEESADPE
jgi:hypothetical protein